MTMTRAARGLMWVSGALVVLLLASPAQAATVTVTSVGDTVTVDGGVTLREAITSINNGANVNADVVASGSYGSSDQIAFAIPYAGSSVQRIVIASPLPSLTRPVRIDGETQTANVGDTNAGVLGSGGVVGTRMRALVQVPSPEIEIRGGAGVGVGLAMAANSVVIRGVAIYGFASANIDVQQNSNSVLIERNVIGATATAFADPGPGVRSGGANIRVGGGTNNGVIQQNLIGFAGGDGIDLSSGGASFRIDGNEIRGNGITSATADGVNLAGQNSVNPLVRVNLIAGNGGFGVDLFVSNGNAVVEENTITGNGVRGTQTAGVGLGLNNNRVSANVIANNVGAGVLVGPQGNGNRILQNSIYGNGTIGIDLLTGSDNQNTGSAPYVTLNDANDSDNGGNQLLNFPIVSDAAINNGMLQLTGFARPGSSIEFFIADPDPSGFGEGRTWLVTLAEQSSADLDTTQGTYGPGPVNGISQGTDTTNRYRFLVPLASLPVTVTAGSRLTATATSANSTSEFSGVVQVAGPVTVTLRGVVFEDVNFGGGLGRSLAMSNGVPRPGALVELYNAAEVLVASTTTDVLGAYAFTGQVIDATYVVRVVNGTVTSSRPGGGASGLWAVQTYRTDVSTRTTLPHGQVGGEDPGAQDSGPKAPGGTLADVAIEQSLTRIVVPPGATSIDGVDFGFNFDTIVNVNDAGQGSLRQFIVNATALGNLGLDQDDTVAVIGPGNETSIFAIPGNGLHTITPTSPLPGVAAIATAIDGFMQSGSRRNTASHGDNAIRTITLNGALAGPSANGFVLRGNGGHLLQGFVISGFTGAGVRASESAGNRVASNVITNNGIGVQVGPDTSYAVITRNSIYANAGLGIDLDADGVTLNDTDDGDFGGGNAGLNFPVITQAGADPAVLEIEGFARPGSVIELFYSTPDPSGFGEGRTYLTTLTEGALDDLDGGTGSYGPIVGGITVGTDTTNRFRFRIPLAALAGSIPSGAALTATATINLATSEFSPSLLIAVPADLSVQLEAPRFVEPGQTLTYTVTMTNNGPGTAISSLVNLEVPAGLTFQATGGMCVTPLPCAFGSMPSGAQVAFTARYGVSSGSTMPALIVGRATVVSGGLDLGDTNNVSTATTLVRSADLSITKTEFLGRTATTDPLAFEIRVRNRGPQPATDVVVNDPTPAGITFVANAGDCTTPFPCALGALAAGEERVIHATYAVPFEVSTPVINTATVSSATYDPVPSNNTASSSAPRVSNLSVSKNGPPTAAPGQTLTYIINVTNGGPHGVSTVTVNDPTPPGLIFVSTSGACDTAFPCTVGPLASGEHAIIRASYLVPPTFTTVDAIVNTVTVSTQTPDPDLTNNRASITSAFIATPGDGDGDGMPDDWETCVGLDPTRNDAAEDPDRDGRTNAQEYADHTHPRGFVRHYLPEGADNAFFQTRFSLVNPDPSLTAHVLYRMQPEGGPEVQACFPLLPGQTSVLDPSVPTALRVGLGLSFATLFETDVALVAERTMTWTGGGAHGDTATQETGNTWFFAEGATHGGFRAYYMLQNPGLDPTTVEMVFVRPPPLQPLVRTYTLPARSRTTIFANEIPELVGMEIAAVVRVISGAPIAAARSMYRDVNGVVLRAGTSATGAAEPALDWYFAEGSSGQFFAEYLLVFNPDAVAAEIDLTFLQAGGAPLTQHVMAPPRSRLTLDVAQLAPALLDTSAGIHVRSTNGVPLVVERSMWWPNDATSAAFWSEGHLSTGVTAPAPRWLFAGKTLAPDTDLYLLLANHGDAAGRVVITLIGLDGATSSREIDLAAQSRATLLINQLAPEMAGRTFRIEAASVGTPLPLVVERAVYRTQNGVVWASGSVTLGTPQR